MKYIKLFDSHTDYQSYIEDDPTLPNISYCIDNRDVHYNPRTHDYSEDYLTFESLDDNNVITFKLYKSKSTGLAKSLTYSTDNGETWATASSGSTEDMTITTLNKGDKLLLKNNTNTYYYLSSGTTYAYRYFATTGRFNISGNYMSLFYGDDFSDELEIPTYTGYYQTQNQGGLFRDCTNLISAENLILPATTLKMGCYREFFKGCTNLVLPPKKLPATIATTNCYDSMFYGCSSLTTIVPKIKLITAGQSCCFSMFRNCTNLTVTPSLTSITTLANSCFNGMFWNCTGLTIAPELPVITLAERCYSNMFYGCTNLTTVPGLPATTLAENCYDSMFFNCTGLTTAPELPATTLAYGCYTNMFYGCTGLTTAPELSAPTLSGYCYNYMFYGCSSLSSIICLATDISADSCTRNWVYSVAATGTFIKNASTSWSTDTNGIPSGWTVQTAQA